MLPKSESMRAPREVWPEEGERNYISIYTCEADREQDVGPGGKTSTLTFSDILPLARLHFLNSPLSPPHSATNWAPFTNTVGHFSFKPEHLLCKVELGLSELTSICC